MPWSKYTELAQLVENEMLNLRVEDLSLRSPLKIPALAEGIELNDPLDTLHKSMI